MRAILVLLYMVVGGLQFLAVHDGLDHWLSLSPLVCIPLALALGFVPIFGTALGGAVAFAIWGWAWWQAGLFFLGGLGATLLVLAALSLVELMSDPRREWLAGPEEERRGYPSPSPISRITSVWSAAGPSASTAFAYSSAQASSPAAAEPRS
jgi:hypothetical protein